MSLDLSALPKDIDALQALVHELASALNTEQLRVEQLKARIAHLRRMQFGRSSEKLDAEIAQLELSLDEIHEEEGQQDAARTSLIEKLRKKRERFVRTPATGGDHEGPSVLHMPLLWGRASSGR